MREELTVGQLLREWRTRRGFSQMTLALQADISTKHLSFLETGRAQPSREMLTILSEELELPNRTRNELWLAAGFRPPYRQSDLASADAEPVRLAIERLLQGHNPNPAVACDALWNVLAMNVSAKALLSGIDPSLLIPPVNLLRVSFSPLGLAPKIRNFAIWKTYALNRLQARIRRTNDAGLKTLATELRKMQDAATPSQLQQIESLLVPIELETSLGVLSMFSATTSFTSVQDVTLSDVMIESFHPSNDESRDILGRLAVRQ